MPGVPFDLDNFLHFALSLFRDQPSKRDTHYIRTDGGKSERQMIKLLGADSRCKVHHETRDNRWLNEIDSVDMNELNEIYITW